MVTTLAMSGSALIKAGVNVHTDFTTDAGADDRWTNLINQAESEINVISRFNWIDAYAGLNVDVKLILEEWCANLAAISAINYDPESYGTRTAELMINVLRDSNTRLQSLLRNQKVVTFINGA